MLANWGGYKLVLLLVMVFLLLLLFLGKQFIVETRTGPSLADVSMRDLLLRMATDAAVVRAALLVAGLNAIVFSFYAAGPFMVGHLPGLGFGWIGLCVAVVGSLGAALNRRLPASFGAYQRVRYGLTIVLGGCIVQLLVVLTTGRAGVLWAISASPVFVGFGLALPNVLGPALEGYKDCLGRAGALFGCAYYSLIGAALACTTVLPFDSPIPLAMFWMSVVAILFVAHGKKPLQAIRIAKAVTYERTVVLATESRGKRPRN
jgi:hypothetical protein